MMRTLVLALACVLLAAPAADAKKPRRPHASKRVAKSKKSKKALVMVHKAPPRVAAIEQHAAPPPEVSTPAPTRAATPAAAPAPSPPVEHGPLGPQAGDDEVPGTRMKR